MSKQFNGTINLDIRDSVPDWGPYAEPKAPEGAPNILYIVMDDTGFGAWEMFGGKIKMPNLKRIADQGLVYTNFHTTALCSPTRSSLLNGRNANSNGMACIEEATTGFPGSNGRIPFENALISEVLVERGYNTYAVGKWHLLPEEEANMAASKRNWPVGRGFERYYGFLGGETDQWHPDLVYDNHLIEPPYKPDMTVTQEDPSDNTTYTSEGYHLSKDLVDKAIYFIQDSKAIAPDKPWLMYFAPGANHAPHHVWPEMILKYGYNQALYDPANKNDYSFAETSVFSEGYEAYRDTVLTNMKNLGIFPPDTEATDINPHEDIIDPNGKPWPSTEYVIPWETLALEEKALFIRMAETYAAFSTYTDEQIGRLLDHLEKTGQMENTIIVVVSDNGSSAEGGPNGSVNENLFFNDIPDSLETNLEYLADLGTDKTYNHYPSGWAWAFDTPFMYWKRWSSYEGGAATPFMISWPKHIKVDPGFTKDSGFRKQYIHAIDLIPTLYECLGVEPPEVVNGYTQNPIEGISFAYTFESQYDLPEYQYPYKLPEQNKPKDKAGNLKKVKETQFYAMLGTRGIWHQGWFACTLHPPTPSDWGDFHEDVWELYCMDGYVFSISNDDPFDFTLPADPTQCQNLVAPDYLASLPSNEHRAELKKILERMQSKWFSEAGRYNGMPLDDRSTSVILGEERPQLSDPPFDSDDPDTATFDYIYYPGGSEIPEAVAPNIRTRSYEITATVDFSEATYPTGIIATPRGVLYAQGGRFGGHSLYIHRDETSDYKLCYVYNWLGQQQQKISCLLGTLTGNQVTLKVSFMKDRTLEKDIKFGSSTIGAVNLHISENNNGASAVIEGTFPDYPGQFLTQPGKFALCGEGMNIGRDGGQPVSSDYESPGEFVGATIQEVKVTIYNDAEEPDEELIMRAMLSVD